MIKHLGGVLASAALCDESRFVVPGRHRELGLAKLEVHCWLLGPSEQDRRDVCLCIRQKSSDLYSFFCAFTIKKMIKYIFKRVLECSTPGDRGR